MNYLLYKDNLLSKDYLSKVDYSIIILDVENMKNQAKQIYAENKIEKFEDTGDKENMVFVVEKPDSEKTLGELLKEKNRRMDEAPKLVKPVFVESIENR